MILDWGKSTVGSEYAHRLLFVYHLNRYNYSVQSTGEGLVIKTQFKKIKWNNDNLWFHRKNKIQEGLAQIILHVSMDSFAYQNVSHLWFCFLITINLWWIIDDTTLILMMRKQRISKFNRNRGNPWWFQEN